MSKPLSVYLIGAARKVWRWSPARSEAKKRCKAGKKFRCEKCNKLVEKIQIDHISPVGIAPKDWKGWDEYYFRLFCSVDNLQGLCSVCHKAKSKEEAKERAKRRLKNG